MNYFVATRADVKLKIISLVATYLSFYELYFL